MTKWKDDFRVGGKYTVVVVRPDGSKYPASGKFLEINSPYKFSHTRKYEWDAPIIGQTETKITYNFIPINTGTRIIVRHEGFKGFAEAAYEHAQGWERVFRWLDSYLKNNIIKLV